LGVLLIYRPASRVSLRSPHSVYGQAAAAGSKNREASGRGRRTVTPPEPGHQHARIFPDAAPLDPHRGRRALRTRARRVAASRLRGSREPPRIGASAIQREAAPQTIDERLYAATLSINGGKYGEAIAHLRLVRDEDPDNDHAIYMLAVAHAQRDEHAEAVAHLERAIALNPENRALARNDPDLEPLRDDDAFRAALEASSGSRPLARRPLKTRSAR